MPIFEYKCNGCQSVFEQMDFARGSICCLQCGSSDVSRNYDGRFFPKKIFCPKENGIGCGNHS
ncbi:MAG: zinc ribbon domain-containing protein [Candidatus Peregrinibacteria bacterium]